MERLGHAWRRIEGAGRRAAPAARRGGYAPDFWSSNEAEGATRGTLPGRLSITGVVFQIGGWDFPITGGSSNRMVGAGGGDCVGNVLGIKELTTLGARAGVIGKGFMLSTPRS